MNRDKTLFDFFLGIFGFHFDATRIYMPTAGGKSDLLFYFFLTFETTPLHTNARTTQMLLHECSTQTPPCIRESSFSSPKSQATTHRAVRGPRVLPFIVRKSYTQACSTAAGCNCPHRHQHTKTPPRPRPYVFVAQAKTPDRVGPSLSPFPPSACGDRLNGSSPPPRPPTKNATGRTKNPLRNATRASSTWPVPW